jgi:hypothetical protein
MQLEIHVTWFWMLLTAITEMMCGKSSFRGFDHPKPSGNLLLLNYMSIKEALACA